jgi:hypothetical protein
MSRTPHLSPGRLAHLLRVADAMKEPTAMKTIPAPVIDWQGHEPRFPLNWYAGMTAADLAPAGHFGDYFPIEDTCLPECPRCAEMRAGAESGDEPLS